MYDGKPGCFGSPLCFVAEKEPCVRCNHASECKVASGERARALYARFGLTVPTVRKPLASPVISKPIKAVVSSARTASAMPASVAVKTPLKLHPVNKKGADLVARIKARGIDINRALETKTNPFQFNPPAFMRVAVQLLLDCGKLERAEYKSALMKQLNWSEASAASHVGIAFSALAELGVPLGNEEAE